MSYRDPEPSTEGRIHVLLAPMRVGWGNRSKARGAWQCQVLVNPTVKLQYPQLS